jgi:dolichol kinase
MTGTLEAEMGLQAAWVRDEVRQILRDADPSAWRAEGAEELRQRVRAIVAMVRQRSSEALPGGSSPRFAERLRSLVATMERALPAESSRSRWEAFVGTVHPEYEALLAALPPGQTAASHRPTNYARSLFHVTWAAVGVTSVALFPSRAVQLGVASTFATYAWSMEIVRRVSPAFNTRLMRLYGRVAHPHEWYRVNSATWFATALVLLAAFATRQGMIAALAVLGVADPLAALVGRRWGRHPLRAGRSLEGTLAFFVSGALAAAAALMLVGAGSAARVAGLAAAGALAGAFAELWTTTALDDNFTIPAAVGAIVTLGTLGG